MAKKEKNSEASLNKTSAYLLARMEEVSGSNQTAIVNELVENYGFEVNETSLWWDVFAYGQLIKTVERRG